MEDRKFVMRLIESNPIMENSSPIITKHWDFARYFKTLVVLLALEVAFLVLYYASCNSYGQLLPGLERFSSPVVKDEFYELRKILEAASTKDKTVILTTLNEAWAEPNSLFDLFLKSFRTGNNTAPLLNHLLVIAVDEKAYSRCQKLVSHCYFHKTKQSSKMAHEVKFMSPIYMDMMWERLAFLQTILSLGYNFVFTDTDVMWFRDPFPQFTLDSDFQISCDYFNGKEFDIQNTPNNGFLFVRSNIRTIKFYKFWVSSRNTYPDLNEQDVFNQIKKGIYIQKLGVKLRFLNSSYFGGFCQPSKSFNRVCTMHANCCVGLDRKIADLNTTLEVWKTYQLSSSHTAPRSANWTVPNQCLLGQI